MQELRDLARINFGLDDQDITNAFNSLRDAITSGGALGQRAAEVGTTATHVVAGLFIALFCLFFFLYQGEQIWAWVVRLFPRQAREKADSSGRKAWVSLTAFVRATIVVAAVDAIGISLGAAILGLPLVSAIGILVFVGAFIPVVGALISGVVAVLVALVAKGPIIAIIMLAVVIGVQQLEAHVLQPFLLGRAVAVHPLAIILAIATGVIVAGIVGALVAVPTAAVRQHHRQPSGRQRRRPRTTSRQLPRRRHPARRSRRRLEAVDGEPDVRRHRQRRRAPQCAGSLGGVGGGGLAPLPGSVLPCCCVVRGLALTGRAAVSAVFRSTLVPATGWVPSCPQRLRHVGRSWAGSCSRLP